MAENTGIFMLNTTEKSDAYYLQNRFAADYSVNCFSFDNVKDLITGALTAPQNMIIMALPCDSFGRAKTALLKALNAKIVRSSRIISVLDPSIDRASTEFNIQTAVPAGAVVYPSADGTCSAFAFRSGERTFLFAPAEREKFSYILSAGAETLFVKKRTTTEELNEDMAAIRKSGKKIAISKAGCSAALLQVLVACGGTADSFVTLNNDIDKKADEPIAETAKRAMEKTKADYGVCVSAIEDGAITVAIADKETARVAVVYSLPGEDNKHLAAAAVVKICEMMKDASSNGINAPEEKPKKDIRKPLMIAIICLAVAVVACIIIGCVVYATGRNKEASSEEITDITEYLDETTEQYEGMEIYEEETADRDDNGEVVLFGAFDEEADSETDENDTEETTIASTVTTLLSTIKETAVSTTAKKTTTLKATTAKATTKAVKTTTKATTVATTLSTTSKKSKGEPVVVTTTKKGETTTSAATTTKSEEEGTTDPSYQPGTFTFEIYGYGHGVGMSQDGAIAMAKSGSSYSQILTHYFPNTSLKSETKTVSKYITEPETEVDEEGNETVVKEGYTLLEFLCRTTKQEIGASAPLEAMKAQAVCAYTYAAKRGRFQPNDGQAYDASYAYEGTNIEKACMAVLGLSDRDGDPHPIYLSYNGSYAYTYYFANCAGSTVPADSVWGSSTSTPAYLTGGVKSAEKATHTTVTVTVEEFRSMVESYNKKNPSDPITLGEDPSTWLKILTRDCAYSESIGYVAEIRVGDKTMRGYEFRSFMGNYKPSSADWKFKSHCFSLKYTK